MRDIAPVASINRAPLTLTLIVTPSYPARTIPEFIAPAASARRRRLRRV